jgi:hypothetical protein
MRDSPTGHEKVATAVTVEPGRAAFGDIARLHERHPRLRAEDWRSPLVRRLLGQDRYADGERLVETSFKSGGSSEASEARILLHWQNLGEDFAKCLASYQVPIITEFATLGLACVLVFHLTGLEITEVTRRGEKADYWLGNKEFLLEVSGEQAGSLEALCTDKAEQLQQNPFGAAGYVCVAVYGIASARLWFYPARA